MAGCSSELGWALGPDYSGGKHMSTNDFNGPVVGPSKTWVPECPAFMRLPGVLIGFGVTASFAYNSIGCSLPDNWPGNNLGLGGPVVGTGFPAEQESAKHDVCASEQYAGPGRRCSLAGWRFGSAIDPSSFALLL